MDILRGFAVLGILFANISAFSHPMALALLPTDFFELTPTEEWVNTIREVLISGKMRSLLAILFGVGLWMQFSKRQAKEQAELHSAYNFIGPYLYGEPKLKKHWPGTYLKRTLLLLGLGLFHALFIWFGDILFTYALCALLAMTLVRFSDKVIFWIGVGCITLGVIYGIGSTLLSLLPESSAGDGDFTFKNMPILGLQSEVLAYSQGSYLAQVIHRAAAFGINLFSLFFIGPPIFGLFLMGVLFGKRGVFKGGENAEKDIRTMMWVGLGIGLPLNLLPIVCQLTGQHGLMTEAIELGFAPILAIGLLGVCLKVLPLLPGMLTDPFRRVGKVALSCYLLQSVLATSLFYSWGGKLFNKLDWLGQLYVVLIILVICIAAANVWTRYFSIGPVEWAWRSLSEGKRLPWREPSTHVVSPAA